MSLGICWVMLGFWVLPTLCQDSAAVMDKLMVVGGQDLADFDVEIVDLSLANLTCFKPTNVPIRHSSVGTFFNGAPHVCGGVPSQRACYVYDRHLNSWNQSLTMSSPRELAAGVMISEDQWWIMGGTVDGKNWVNTTERMTSGGVSSYLDLPLESYYPTAVRIDNRTLFINPKTTKESWTFDTVNEVFTPMPDMLRLRMSPSVGVIRYPNGSRHLIVAGGFNQKSSESYSFETGQWQFGPDLPVNTGLSLATTVQFQDSFLIVGGSDYGYSSKIIKFDPQIDDWVALPQTLRVARDSLTAFLIPSNHVNCS